MRRFVYRLTEESLGELLASKPIGVEILKREENLITFCTYEPVEGLRLLRVEELSEDWRRWKESFGPVDLGDFVVIPPWKKPLIINPGMAFGTGFHPTTKLCIRMLGEAVKPGSSVLDVGTGSGILAIVAKMLGAGRVVGIDVSEEAVRECEENARLNSVSVECILGRARDVNEVFDLAVANLELSVFREELKDVKTLFRDSAVLSGIYGEEELREFRELLVREGLKAVRILEEENWFCIKVRHERD